MIKIQDFEIGNNKPFVLIAGPCVIENEELIYNTADFLVKLTKELGIPLIFKSSYKKANRTSGKSFTGIGDKEALQILDNVRRKYNVPVLTDIHSVKDAEQAAKYVDILQIPAFLCRQTDLLVAAGKTGKVVNIKKGQFLAPEDMKHAAEKVASSGNNNIMLTERGTTFGYHNLVVDMRSFIIMKEIGYPVVMDATHSVQLPSNENTSGGQPKYIKPLAKAATAVGIDALFLEVHPQPEKALSDAASQLPLNDLRELLEEVQSIDKIIKKY
ncbi:MAG TPA: 3-deoxy-8-phosphooctulonate synthase [Ignavibacteriaceae bacterium]|nr:3-deoxy-8-phosphooctulonate synthase [Ignavibacteriaceae bacterium]